jgi:hypothetical protein
MILIIIICVKSSSSSSSAGEISCSEQVLEHASASASDFQTTVLPTANESAWTKCRANHFAPGNARGRLSCCSCRSNSAAAALLLEGKHVDHTAH